MPISALAQLLKFRVIGPVLFHLRLGPVETVLEITAADSSYGQLTVRTANGTVLRVTRDRARWPKPRLQRRPGPGSGPSSFDAPAMVTVRGFKAVVGERMWAEDTSGSSLGQGATWTTSEVQEIELRRTHCPACDRALLRGRCWQAH